MQMRHDLSRFRMRRYIYWAAVQRNFPKAVIPGNLYGRFPIRSFAAHAREVRFADKAVIRCSAALKNWMNVCSADIPD